MKNVVVCKNCNSENPFYELICRNCRSFLREKVFNIDLWKTISQLIESPSAAFRNIIFSEHKNYLPLLLFLISGKLFLNGIFLLIFFYEWNARLTGIISSYLIILVLIIVLFFFFVWLFGGVSKIFGITTRFKDNLSILIYSFLPYTFGLLILFLLELIIFGETLFYFDPSPFLIKETIAYTFLITEILLILWSFFLTFTAFKVQSGNIFYSLIFSLLIHTSVYITIYFSSAGIYL